MRLLLWSKRWITQNCPYLWASAICLGMIGMVIGLIGIAVTLSNHQAALKAAEQGRSSGMRLVSPYTASGWLRIEELDVRGVEGFEQERCFLYGASLYCRPKRAGE